jgi:transcriptional regulator with XRE-family HTH domain
MKPKQLLEIRKSKKMNRDEMAKRLGCSASALYKWEKGERRIPKWVIEKTLATVEIPISLHNLYQISHIAAEQGITIDQLIKNSITAQIAAETAPPYPAKKNTTQKPKKPWTSS